MSKCVIVKEEYLDKKSSLTIDFIRLYIGICINKLWLLIIQSVIRYLADDFNLNFESRKLTVLDFKLEIKIKNDP